MKDIIVKYRAKKFKDIIGNNELKKIIIPLVKKEIIPSLILLTGPSGCGKTTIARIIANTIKAKIIEMNMSSNNGVDAARELVEFCKYPSMSGRKKLYILNECHRTTKDFQNVMLEAFEEPPPNTSFIMVTTEPNKLLNTIHTRALHLKVELLKSNFMKLFVKNVLKQEKKSFGERIIERLIQESDGQPRKALRNIQSVLGAKNDKVALKILSKLEEKEEVAVNEICKSIVNGNNWNTVRKILSDLLKEFDPNTIRAMMLAWFAGGLMRDGRPKQQDMFCGLCELFEDSLYDPATAKSKLIMRVFAATK